MSIVVKTLSEHAYEIIRERILSNDLLPLKPLRQDVLSKELGISKIPLREALARLENDRLLISHPNRGYLVPQLTMEDAEDIFHLRALVESDLAARACVAASEADKQLVRDALAEFNKLENPDAYQLIRANRAFHIALIGPLQRSTSHYVLGRLLYMSDRYLQIFLTAATRRERAIPTHNELAEAWLAGETERVHRLLQVHNLEVIEVLREEVFPS
ncbi:GntR family transcriptional regulator [Shewanella avicenniae]|uniref:GntR family transcriptional regulator n=1 Tax=Shewanella avicenniae TaxID=2814294 RepID=A0ABX7QTR4_9GAMM|nr:GntR family transcriptional regulator [Shewanella avicenniae]QSX34070.1 GntR family transcriptional regulator [Shewanella avicenniae]